MGEAIELPGFPSGEDEDAVERIIRGSIDPAARVAAVELLSGASINTVLGVDLAGGERVVLKVRYGAGQDVFAAEAHQLEVLAGKASFPVPRVLAHRKDGALGPLTFLILSRLSGVPWRHLPANLGRTERESLERELGGLLGRFHREGAGQSFGEVLPGPAPGFRSWPELFSRFWQRSIEELMRTDRLDPPVLDAVASIHASLDKLLRTADVPRLVHGDLGPAKVLCEPLPGGAGWRVSGLIGPSLAYAHREVDLAAVELYLGAGAPFLEGYRAEMPIDEGYEGRKLLYMLYSTLDNVRAFGDTNYILGAIDLVRRVVRRWGDDAR